MALPHRSFLRRLPLRQIACLVPVAVVGVWVSRHRPLIAADRYWLLAAVPVTGLGWAGLTVASTAAGAGERRAPQRGTLPPTDLACRISGAQPAFHAKVLGIFSAGVFTFSADRSPCTEDADD